jgi:hypothetical protein
MAQSDVPTTGSASGPIEIGPEQRTLLKRYAIERHATPVRLKERIMAGSTVPTRVQSELEPLPVAIIHANPRLKDFSYFLSDTGTYVVDPSSNQVITSID